MGEPEDGFRIRFAIFELDTRSGELRKAGTRIKLQDQPLKILIAELSQLSASEPGKCLGISRG